MKNKKKTVLLSVLCGAFALTAAFGGALVLQKDSTTAAAETAEIVAGQIEENYTYGTMFDLPDSVQITVGDQEYTAEKGYIVYPDGYAYSGAENYELNKIGEYTVVYEKEVEGEVISAEHKFSVKADLYATEGAVTVSYDTLRAFSVYEHMTQEQSDEGRRMGDLLTDVKGLNVSLEAGSVFTYSKPVNIYDNTVNNVIEFNVMQLDASVGSWKVTLTDCYDPNTHIDFSFRRTSNDYASARMSAYGLASVGLVESKTTVGEVYFDGRPYNKDNNGAPVKGNRSLDLHPYPALKQDRYNNISIRLDTTDQKAIMAYLDFKSSRGEEPGSYLIGQFNNEKLLPYAFDGFTTGDVYVSVSAGDYNGIQEAEIEIKSIMGDEGDALLPRDYEDKVAPTIAIDAPEGVLEIVTGSPIAVPTATALDTSGLAADVDYIVWYGYETENNRMVQIKDGHFTPSVLGKYTVEYFVSDVHGNKTTALLELNAVREGVDPIMFTCEEITNVAAGEYVTFDGYVLDSLTEIRSFVLTLSCPNGDVKTITDPSAAFLLEGVGEYTVKYTYADLFYKGEYSYSFTANNDGVYAFTDSVIVPKYLIKGANYTFETPSLYQYTGETPASAAIKAYIRYDSNDYVEFDPKAVTITGKKNAMVKYACAADETVYVESEEMTIVDVEYGTADFDKTKYFVGNFTASAVKDVPDRTTFTYKFTSTSKPELEFINPLSLSSFATRFTVPEGQKTKAVTLVLTDYYNRENTAELEISQDASGAYFSFNGSAPERVGDTFVGSPMTVSYDGAGTLMIGATRVKCPIEFTSDLCMLTFRMTGLTHGHKFELFSICNQQFGYFIKSDTSKPIISAELPEAIAKVGDVISIAKPVCTDVFSPNTMDNCTVSVYKNGKSIQSTSGVELKNISDFDSNYKFEIDDYGSYLIVYEYKDGAGKKSDLRHTIKVTDAVAPTLEFKDYNGAIVNVNTKAIVPVLEYTISDNYTALEDLEVWVFVYNSKGACVSASKDSFTVNKAGTYTVWVYCIDEAGNSSALSYQIKAR